MPNDKFKMSIIRDKFAGRMDELFTAYKNGDLPTVEKIIDEYVIEDSLYDFSSSPFYSAAEEGHLEIIKLMINRGVKIKACNKFYELDDAVLGKGGVEIVKYFLDLYERCEGFDRKIFMVRLNDALSQALWAKKINVAEFLISRGASIQKVHEWSILYSEEDNYMVKPHTINFWFALREKGTVFSLEEIRQCTLVGEDLFYFLPIGTMDNPKHLENKEKIISIYLAGVDLSKQINFFKHQPWLEHYASTVKTELIAVVLATDLAKLIILFL